MLELIAIALGTAVVGSGGLAYRLFGKRRAHERWKTLLLKVAEKKGGRASPGSMFDAPELRIEWNGTTVTLKLVDIDQGPEGSAAVAAAALPEHLSDLRLYFGWDVDRPPPEVSPLPEVNTLRQGQLSGQVLARADDPDLAERFLKHALHHLVDVRREAHARSVEVLARGGHVTLTLNGIQETEYMLERIVIVSSQLGEIFTDLREPAGLSAKQAGLPGDGPASGAPKPTSLAPPDSRPHPGRPCTLCGLPSQGRERFVCCIRCQSIYHQGCFHQAARCVEDGCGETQAKDWSRS